MAQIRLRFYEELNDFLVPSLRKIEFTHDFDRRASVKDIIESFGVPHTEVELILVNSKPVDFSYRVHDSDRISIYPMFESLDVSPILRLRSKPLRTPRYVLDCNLGRLARYLRMLGFDCLYRNDYDDRVVAKISSERQRTVLTRDRVLLKRKIITHGYFVRETKPRLQVKEVLQRFDLYRSIAPFRRCTRCNGELQAVSKQAIENRLEPLTKKYYHRFRMCTGCQQIYWHGTHQIRAERFVEEVRGMSGGEARKMYS